jgi:DNA polymerase
MDSDKRLWHALNLLEDLVRYGERTPHDDPPASVGRRAERVAGPVGAGSAGAEPGALSDERGAADSPPAARSETELREERLAAIAERVRKCTRCPLHEGRMNAVPGAGVLDPLVMVIGEGPGAEEDRRGVPFVGRAGIYLDKWLEAIDVSRDTSAFIGNIVKCRPPGNRDPRPPESDACMPYLREQIELIRPRTILTVGRIASGILIGSPAGIGSLRGRTYYYDGIPLIPTYHPSAVLRNQDLRRPVWEDLKRLSALFDEIRSGEEQSGA